MNESRLKSSYLHRQLGSRFLSRPVSSFLNISSKWVWWTWGKTISLILLKQPRGQFGKICRAERHRIEKVFKKKKEKKRGWGIEREAFGRRMRGLSGLTFTLQKMVKWLPPRHDIISRSPGEQKSSSNVHLVKQTMYILYKGPGHSPVNDKLIKSKIPNCIHLLR